MRRAIALILFSLYLGSPAEAAVHRYRWLNPGPLPTVRIPQYIVVDLAAELPAIDVREGDVASAKDTDSLYRHNGLTWVAIGGAGGPHNLLSATHTDTLAASPVRGDVLVGNTTPAWARLAIGGSATFLRSNATDPAWAAIGFADLPAAAQGWTDDGAVVRLTTSSNDVGIGTATTGGAKLYVLDTAVPAAVIEASGAAGVQLNLMSSASGNPSTIRFTHVGDAGLDPGPINITADTGDLTLTSTTTVATETSVFDVNKRNATVGISQAARIRRFLTGGGSPLAGFGSSLDITLQGFTASDRDAARIASGWEIDQTNTTTDVDTFLSFYTTLNEAMAEKARLTSGGRLGLGTTLPEALFHMDGAADTGFVADQYNTGAGGPEFLFRKARGTKGGETQVVANDRLAVINGKGWTDAGSFGGNSAAVRLTALEPFTAAAQGTAVQLMTNAIGGTTLTQRARADGVGLIAGAGAPHTKLQAEGPIALAYAATSIDLTLDGTHSTVAVDTTGGNRIITLPTAVGIAGRVYIIKRTTAGANTLTVDGNGAQTIDGAANVTLALQWDVVRVQSDGANWLLI